MTAPRSRTRSKTSSTTTTPNLTAEVPGFAKVEPLPPEPTNWTEAATPEEGLSLGPQPSSDSEPDDSSGGLHDGQLPPKEAAGPTPASTKPLDPKQLREPIRAAVMGLSMAANQVLAAPIDEALQVETGLWLASEDDAAAIGDPLAAIAARRAPVGLGGANDLGDALAALFGLIGYGMRHLMAHRQYRKLLRAGGISVLEQDGAATGEEVPA